MAQLASQLRKPPDHNDNGVLMTTNFENGWPETNGPAASGRITAHVYWLTVLLIVIAAASLAVVGYLASRSADRQALKHEAYVFDNALRDHQLLTARDQLTVAHWDDAVEHIVKGVEPDFIKNEFLNALWNDFGIHRSFLIGPGDELLASTREHQADFTRRVLAEDDPVRALADKLRKRIAEGLPEFPAAAAAGAELDSTLKLDEVADFAFARIEGQPMLLSAVQILPEERRIDLNKWPVVILVAAKAIDQTFLQQLTAPLDLMDIAFLDGQAPEGKKARRELMDHHGDVVGTFTWHPERPGLQIWKLILPVAIGLCLLLSAAALLISRKIVRLTRSLERSEAINHFNARHDPLTGCRNRLAFSEILEAACSGLPGTPFALIACDLDNFKSINDTSGHAAGDEVLKTIARRLRQIVEPAGYVGRIGGDEFLIVVSLGDGSHELEQIAEQILAEAHVPVELETGESFKAGMSLGIARAPDCGHHGTDLLRAADVALYKAKQTGRNRACFADHLPVKPSLKQSLISG
ncbi:diguanylate cyclase domain-containing protein [Roseibium litorale]|uniref:Diguanylate cyclase n=1 Tax=Roseibium litorale TaxID=2803841 RepID=A0ABR9CPP8_9HYPH|nr:diguanylate cyclase [Roseibium litorale]MBD8892817.1 diguanylate cyclase [Roseibium litorale]